MMENGILNKKAMTKDSSLPASFYTRSVVTVAQDLIGKTLVFNGYEGIITETEAYRGADDEASHAFRGRTPRSNLMFGPPGYSYVYFIYGMYHCLNIVTEPESSPSAVLIRGIDLTNIHLNGPGKLCRHLGITKEHNGVYIIDNIHFTITESKTHVYGTPKATPRIGIKKATDKLWRFIAQSEDKEP